MATVCTEPQQLGPGLKSRPGLIIHFSISALLFINAIQWSESKFVSTSVVPVATLIVTMADGAGLTALPQTYSW